MIKHPTIENINKAIELLEKGEIISIPTETVYGLAAAAFDDKAVAKIFALKGRPNFNPLISHYAELREIEKDVYLNKKAIMLAEKFWPGPMTLVLNKQEESRISQTVSANLSTAAVRIPNHPVSLKLLKLFEAPLAAPSANPSGKLSPSKAEHVQDFFLEKSPFIIDGGQCEQGLESTIIDLSSDKVKILRYGTISKNEIESVLNENILSPDSESGIKAPGMLLKHYSPLTDIEINISVSELERNPDQNKNIALVLFGTSKENLEIIANERLNFSKVVNLSEGANLEEAAQKLFSVLHELDKLNLDKILVQEIPKSGIGLAINDRLKRASQK